MADSKTPGAEHVAPLNGEEEVEPVAVEHHSVRPQKSSLSAARPASASSSSGHGHGAVELVDSDPSSGLPPIQITAEELDRSKGRFGYLKKRQFWIVLILSQALALTSTGTSTFTTLLVLQGTNIPAFQSLFNYILLNIIYTSWTIYKYGFKGWLRLLWTDGWRYFILAFFDVEGNYFTVLAYDYSNILYLQLIGFWAIVVVVVVSLIFLKVRYHLLQYLGIIVCCGGLGILIASNYITGGDTGGGTHALKGDLFCLLGATFYGLSNVTQEFLVSKKPMYEVIGQLAFWAMFINGTQAGIFDRKDFQNATWNGKVGGYMTGYTLLLTWFYTGVPVLLRMSSAAFFNIGLLTSNFWGVIVGIQVFNYHVHWMYPIAFVLIMAGHFVYYGTEGVLGEAKKPWLGENQEGGSDGLGTARRQLEHPGVTV